MIIRQAALEDAAKIARVHVDTWRTAYRGIVPEEYLANMSYEESEKRWAGRLSDSEAKIRIYVAEDEAGHIAGFVCGGVTRLTGGAAGLPQEGAAGFACGGVTRLAGGGAAGLAHEGAAGFACDGVTGFEGAAG